MPPRDAAGDPRADRPVHIAHLGLHGHGSPRLDGLGQARQEMHVEREVGFRRIPLRCSAVGWRGGVRRVRHRRTVQDPAEVEAGGRAPGRGRYLLQAVAPPDRLRQRAEAERRQVFAHLPRQEAHEGDHVLRPPGEVPAQLRILRRHADRTGVAVALAHHDAAQADQHRGGETELLRPQQRGDHDIASGLELAVDLQAHAATQSIEQQGLLRLGESQFPGCARVADRGQRRGAGAAVVAADQHAVGAGLDHARRHRAHPGLGNQLDRNLGLRIDLTQIVDQLLDVLDRVDVVVRRRRDERHARRGMAHARDDCVDLVSGKLPSLARLGALGDLDLELAGADAVRRRHAEAAAGHLLDRAAAAFAAGQGRVAGRILAALAAVAAGAEAVHRAGDRLVRLGTERAEGHGAGDEAAHDLLHRLDLVQRHRFGRPEGEGAAQGEVAPGTVVDARGIVPVAIEAFLADGLLQQGDGLGAPEVPLAVAAHGIEAAARQHGRRTGWRRKGRAPARVGVASQPFEAEAADPRDGAGKVAFGQRLRESDRLEHLRAAVAPQRRDAHLGHDLAQTLVERRDIVLDGLDDAHAAQPILDGERGDVLEGEVGVHGRRAVAEQQDQVHDLARLGRLDQQAGGGAESGLEQVAVDRRDRQQGGDGGAAFRQVAVAQDHEGLASGHGGLRLCAEPLQRLLQPGGIPGGREPHGQRAGAEARGRRGPQQIEIVVGQHRVAQLDEPCMAGQLVQDAGGVADERHQRHHQLLADRIHRRVGDLREHLLEVSVEQLRLFRADG